MAEYRRLLHISHLLESKKKRKKMQKWIHVGKQKHEHTMIAYFAQLKQTIEVKW